MRSAERINVRQTLPTVLIGSIDAVRHRTTGVRATLQIEHAVRRFDVDMFGRSPSPRTETDDYSTDVNMFTRGYILWAIVIYRRQCTVAWC